MVGTAAAPTGMKVVAAEKAMEIAAVAMWKAVQPATVEERVVVGVMVEGSAAMSEAAMEAAAIEATAAAVR